MSSSKSKKFLVAAALAATLGGALPAEAADWGASPADLLDRLVTWAVNIWSPAGSEGELGRVYAPEGGYVDPNGGGPKPGVCDTDPGCNSPKSAVAAGRP